MTALMNICVAALCLVLLAPALRADNQAQKTVGKKSDDKSEVCYGALGCFRNHPPFDNALGYLPSHPATVAPEFRLYLSASKTPIRVDYLEPMSAKVTGFDPSLPTKVIIHGFANSLDKSAWIGEMRNAILDLGHTNVLEVGWNTEFPNYEQAVANTRLVGRAVVLVLQALQTNGLDLSNVHLIGHSLGAHIAGYAGRDTNSALARVTGLDPAGPNFATSPPEVRLDPSDAKFVDVIHSNGHHLNLLSGGFGTLLPSGHVDFFPNGGVKQPGCKDGLEGGAEKMLSDFLHLRFSHIKLDVSKEIGCSHGRSAQIFTESVRSSSCKFYGIPCASYDDFLQGECTGCGPKGCNSAGMYADINRAGGHQFFETSGSAPLCGFPYLLTIVPSGGTDKLEGELKISVTGSKAVGEAKVTGKIQMNSGKPFKKMVIFNADAGAISEVMLRYERKDWFKRRQVVLVKVEIEKLWGEAAERITVSSTRAYTKLRTHQDLHIAMVQREKSSQ